MISNKYLLPVFLLSSLLLSACGDKGSDHHGATSQVVAKVNGDEISVHQVNLQMSRIGKVTEEQSKEIAKSIVAKLVDQQLLVQQATAAKLDRDPRVLQILEASKAEILAQAYLEQLAAKAQKPTESEMDAFYNDHPELFAHRRIFRLQELVVSADPAKYAEIETGIKDLKSINEVAAWLRDNKYAFNVNTSVKPAEQLPENLLKLLQPLKDGENLVLRSERSFNIVNLGGSQDQPIARDKATPMMEQYFLNKHKAEIAKKEMESLRSKAKIEYMGEFASMKTDAKQNSENKAIEPSTAKTESTSQPEVSKKEGQSSPKPNENQSTIDKGLAGM
jgi:EpsD family peptidyl-prolyl cis-trans isomerase